MIDIDIFRLSASRPEMLKQSTESIQKYLKYSGKIRYIFHEDILNEKASKQCIRYMKDNFEDGNNIIGVNDPPIGHGASLTWLLDHSRAQYILNWEDDQELIRELDLDPVIAIMEKYPDKINQISFHKRKVEFNHHGMEMREIEYDGYKIVTNPHWAYVPAVWRMSYIMPIWIRATASNHHWIQNASLKGIKVNDNVMRSAQWVLENTKTFYWGPYANGAYIKHLGSGQSLRTGDYKFNG